MIFNGKLICPEVRIENCSACNAWCTICPREKMTRPACIMPYSHFIRLVDQAKELGANAISIFGYGEPLLDKGIVKKIKYCTKKKLQSFITTNASLLDNELIYDLIDAGLTDIRFSAHGFVTKNYEAVHRGLKWERVRRNIFNFIASNKKKHNRVKTHISVIPMNGESIEDIRHFWEDHVVYLEIWRPHNWAYGRKYRNTMPRKQTCGRPLSGPVQINADGNIMVCCFDFDGRMIIGNTYDASIREILVTSDTLNTIQECHRMGIFGDLPCETCDQLNMEDENPLLYSNRDEAMEIGKTSTMKFKLGGHNNGR